MSTLLLSMFNEWCQHLEKLPNELLGIDMIWMKSLKTLLNLEVASIILALLAALFWFYSAVVRVKYREEVTEGGWIEAADIVDGNDFIRTVQRQSLWSAWAAIAAALAAVCQLARLAIHSSQSCI